MAVTLKYCSLHYLNLWLSTEKDLHHKLQSGDTSQKLHALKEGATNYGVARSLPTKYEERQNKKRYAPILHAIERENLRDLSKANFVDKVIRTHEIISEFYGDRTVISATSKFLWLKYRHPFVIIDSQAKDALSFSGNDYQEYVKLWANKYSEVRENILQASKQLPSIKEFTIDNQANIEEICQQEWFIERVFDIYLWHKGSNN